MSNNILAESGKQLCIHIASIEMKKLINEQDLIEFEQSVRSLLDYIDQLYIVCNPRAENNKIHIDVLLDLETKRKGVKSIRSNMKEFIETLGKSITSLGKVETARIYNSLQEYIDLEWAPYDGSEL